MAIHFFLAFKKSTASQQRTQWSKGVLGLEVPVVRFYRWGNGNYHMSWLFKNPAYAPLGMGARFLGVSSNQFCKEILFWELLANQSFSAVRDQASDEDWWNCLAVWRVVKLKAGKCDNPPDGCGLLTALIRSLLLTTRNSWSSRVSSAQCLHWSSWPQSSVLWPVVVSSQLATRHPQLL